MSQSMPFLRFSFVMVDMRPELIPASEYYKNRVLTRQKIEFSVLLFISQESCNPSSSFLPHFSCFWTWSLALFLVLTAL